MQPENEKQNVDVAPPLKKFLRTPMIVTSLLCVYMAQLWLYRSACQPGVSYTPGCTRILSEFATAMGCTGVCQVCALEEQSHCLTYNVLSSISVC